ncbi:STAS domain-containing protein [Streptomyces griseoluteus]|uniref:STAS domain-containing protein n=1 Tax=Streptomyces griseoluteus TaxID=29306 RepID=UPI00382A3FC1
MNITTVIDGTSARITPRGDIDFETLPPLRAAAQALPTRVTDLLWDLHHTAFMDVAGLHLLFDHLPVDGPDLHTTVTGLRQQPQRLLLMAAAIHPATFDLSRLFPDAPLASQPASEA